MLKRIVMLASCVVLAPSTWAGNQDSCRVFSDVAKSIMTARQDGKPMADMMDAASSGSDKSFAATSKQMVVAAYEKPRFGSKAMKQSAVVDFQNDVYLECIKSSE